MTRKEPYMVTLICLIALTLAAVLLVRGVRKAKSPHAGPYTGLRDFSLSILVIIIGAVVLAAN